MSVHRPTISEIEAGRRAVSTDELYRLARIYVTSVGALLGDAVPDEEEALRVLFRGDRGLTPDGRVAAQRFFERCRAERELEDILESAPAFQVRPGYQVGVPATKSEAIRQGERVASEERRRLDLGSEPIRNFFELIEAPQIHLGPLERCGRARGRWSVFRNGRA